MKCTYWLALFLVGVGGVCELVGFISAGGWWGV